MHSSRAERDETVYRIGETAEEIFVIGGVGHVLLYHPAR